MSLSLAHARAIADGTLAQARGAGMNPMSVMVLDGGGHPVVFCREDGCSLFRFDIARAKAMGALGMGMDTRDLAARAANNPVFFNSVAIATGGNLAFSAGGVLIRDSAGNVIGAAGTSGDSADNDEIAALAGIEAARAQGFTV